MVGGVVYAGVGLTEARLVEYLYYVNNIGYGFVAILLPLGAMAAILALYALHRGRYGRAGALLCLMAVLGLALATGVLALGTISSRPNLDALLNVLVIGLLVATVGLVLLGGLSVAWQILPRWCAIALMVGSPFGVFLTMIFSAALALAGGSPIGLAFQALGGLPWVVVGYYIFRAAGRGTEQPARVR
jgi:hypothetical protein